MPESLERENNRLDRNCFGIGFLKLTYTCWSNKVTYFAMLARNLVYQNWRVIDPARLLTHFRESAMINQLF